MDIAFLIGLFGNFALLCWAILLGAPLMLFYDFPSVVMVIGGCIFATMTSLPFEKFKQVGSVMKKAVFFKKHNILDEIDRLAEYATLARKEGLLALEEKIAKLNDPFLIKGLRLVVDGFPPETVKDILSTDVAGMAERHSVGKAVLDKFAETGPAFGMLGTLVGLVQMLSNLSDPSKIGAGMAVALLTTFYGAVIANVMFIPMACRVDQRKKEEIAVRGIMIEGIAAIQAGDKPQMVKEKLRAFLSPRLRMQMDSRVASAPK